MQWLQSYFNAMFTISIIVANCGDPEILPTANDSVLVPSIEDYSGLPIEGTTIRFSCPPGLKLIDGPYSAICTENGEWEPDLNSLILCNDSKGFHTVYIQ